LLSFSPHFCFSPELLINDNAKKPVAKINKKTVGIRTSHIIRNLLVFLISAIVKIRDYWLFVFT